MRARNIKPTFFQNELLTEIDFAGRLLFIGLWTLADREGRLEDRPKRIKMQLFAMDPVDVDQHLRELAELGFIERYQRDGCEYIQIVNFKKHQRPHSNELQSVIPPSIEEAAANHSEQDVQPRLEVNDDDQPEFPHVDAESSHGEQDVQPRSKALRSESLNTDTPFTDTGIPNGSVSHETASKRVSRKAVEPTELYVVWSGGCAIAGVDEQDAADTKPTQMRIIKSLLKRYPRDDLVACFGWLWDQPFERDRGVDWERVRQRIDAWITKGKPPPRRVQIENQTEYREVAPGTGVWAHVDR